MDIATIIGLILGIGLICGAILLKTSLLTFFDLTSAVVVIGGSIAAVLVSFPLKQVLRVFGVVKQAFFAKTQDYVTLIVGITKLAEIARRDGILSLESALTEGEHDDFLVRGLRMAIDGQDPAVIQAALEAEVESLAERHEYGKAIFDNLGKYAPAFGMIGTLIGLVIMLQNMSDPSSLGPAMAVALITTFYGALIANAFAMPVADKLALRNNDEIATKLLIIKGVMSIQAGDNPRIVQQKLTAFLDAQQRKLITDQLEG